MIVFTAMTGLAWSCTPRYPVPAKGAAEPRLSVEVEVSPHANEPSQDTPIMPVSQTQSSPNRWQTMHLLPQISSTAVQVYQQGLSLGNNPNAFSKVGDGEIASSWFLSVFDAGSSHYDLGPHSGLTETIEYFEGSFDRVSLAARAGFNTTRILDPLFVMNDVCEVDESPLECELRLHRPSFAIISLGTNQIWTPGIFETELRQIVDICMARGVVPVLSTKGDNLEGDHRINSLIASIALEYDIPLWNFWAAIQPLPMHGLQPDGEHLTWAENDFTDPEAMSHAWPVRNLSALQLLESLVVQLSPR